MLMFFLSLVFVATAFCIGAIIVRTIFSIIPLSILARAADAGRYVRLGAVERPARTKPTAGRRTPLQPGGRADACRLAGAAIR